MTMLKTCICFFVSAIACHAARVEQIRLDLNRPQQPFAITLTESTDATVSAELLASGAEFSPSGWTGLLWFGSDGGGVTLTNCSAAMGEMSWNVSSSVMPTNGRYSVQILGVTSNRTEDWGRGALAVRINPSVESLPTQWVTNTPPYSVALRALAAATDHAARTDNPHGTTAAQIGAATPQMVSDAITILSNALASASSGSAAKSDSAYRLSTTNGLIWMDATGALYRVTFVTNYTVSLPPQQSPFVWPWPSGIGAFPFTETNTWTGYFSGGYAYVEYTGDAGTPFDNITWSGSSAGSYPLSLLDPSRMFGACTIAQVVSSTTQAYDRVAFFSDLSRWSTNGLASLSDVSNAITGLVRASVTNGLISANGAAALVASRVASNNGVATNLTARGWFALPQTQATNLVLHLWCSNDVIFTEGVFQ